MTRPASAKAWVLLLGLLPGIEVTAAAAGGQQAIDLVTEHHPDAILLDLHMLVLGDRGYHS
jgi:CheY-like chemotaxis protein